MKRLGHKIGKMQVAGVYWMRQAERGGVINLFNSYPGDRKNIWRDGGGVREGSLKFGDSN